MLCFAHISTEHCWRAEMEVPASLRHPLPALPVEVWKEIASYLGTAEWAIISRLCRTTAQVHPRMIELEVNLQCEQLTDLRWAMKHCSEAEDMSIHITNPRLSELPGVMLEGSQNLRHLQRLHLDFHPPQLDFHPEPLDSWPGYDEGELPWLLTFLQRATQLKALRLEAVRIDVGLLQVKEELRHVWLSFRLPFAAEACHALQSLPLLETLHLDVGFDSVEDNQVVHISGLDLTGCQHLRAIHIALLEPKMLKVPPGCFVSRERDILWLDGSKWLAGAANLNSCFLRSNAFNGEDEDIMDECPNLAGCLSWLIVEPMPQLTRLELDYPKLSSSRHPLLLTERLMWLRHLIITTKDLYLNIGAPTRLETFIVVSQGSVTLGVPDVSAFASGLKRLELEWQSCCSTTYKLATLLTSPDSWYEGAWYVPRYTKIIFPHDQQSRDPHTSQSYEDTYENALQSYRYSCRCKCGTCYICYMQSMDLWSFHPDRVALCG